MMNSIDILTLAARDPVGYAIGRVLAVVLLVLLIAGIKRVLAPRNGPG
jgi:hypothetical protein